MSISYYIQLVINGIALGSVYSLIALGFTLIFSVLKFSNFSHGGVMVVSAYFAYIACKNWNLGFIPMVLLTVVFGGLLSCAVQYLGFERLRKTKGSSMLFFVSSSNLGTLLQHGAKKIYSVDVGYGQLAWKLRTDERVVNLERTNLRYVTEEQIPEPIELAVMDVSFISIKLVIPAVHRLLVPDADYICLIKPQFEAGREEVGKKGVVRDRAVHEHVVQGILDFAREEGFSVLGLDYSPIKGPEGNIEYICHLRNCPGQSAELDVSAVVSASHETL